VETENFFKRDNSVKNHGIMTKFKFYLHISMMYPYIKIGVECVQPLLVEVMNRNSMITEQGNTICPWPYHGWGIKKNQNMYNYET
jgi:hypothetical protein